MTFLRPRLRGKDLEVIPQASDGANLFRGLAELQPYDTVVLANVPRDHFSDDQIKALVRNTQQMGAGLIMLGGEHSLGAGGWTNSELEKAMPVEFQIRNTKVAQVGALVMIMHASEMARGNHWQKTDCQRGDQGDGRSGTIAVCFTGTAPTNGCGAGYDALDRIAR